MLNFDESLTAFAEALLNFTSPQVIESNLFLREGSGKLTFIVQNSTIDGAQRRAIAAEVAQQLHPYVDPDGFAVATPEEIFEPELTASGSIQEIFLDRLFLKVRLIDRRVVGADWLRVSGKLSDPPCLVFASLKGGVGRSTALCVCAAYLAARGMRVLAVDMDIEAPGLGTMLLHNNTTPKFGLLDYLVESNLDEVGGDFMRDLSGPSWLGDGMGVVDVIPALGRSSLENPSNVISKISRAYLDINGSVAVRLEKLLSFYSGSGVYDAILIDARAGLHETSAAALLSAGGHIFLFGADQPQTYAGFEVLFANLAIVRDQDWSERLTIVHAKAPPVDVDESESLFSERIREQVTRWLQPGHELGSPDVTLLRDVFDVAWDDDEEASRSAESVLEDAEQLDKFAIVSILESELFIRFDPIQKPDRLHPAVYEAVYGTFIGAVGNIFVIDQEDMIQ
jgi:MinD-like ATPase involved in chromosome partitioning or flagellar assembly